jgi:hypothetical protein
LILELHFAIWGGGYEEESSETRDWAHW